PRIHVRRRLAGGVEHLERRRSRKRAADVPLLRRDAVEAAATRSRAPRRPALARPRAALEQSALLGRLRSAGRVEVGPTFRSSLRGPVPESRQTIYLPANQQDRGPRSVLAQTAVTGVTYGR